MYYRTDLMKSRTVKLCLEEWGEKVFQEQAIGTFHKQRFLVWRGEGRGGGGVEVTKCKNLIGKNKGYYNLKRTITCGCWRENSLIAPATGQYSTQVTDYSGQWKSHLIKINFADFREEGRSGQIFSIPGFAINKRKI